jgi:hypothetical protein
MTVSPSYQQRNVPNPFYTVDITVDNMVKRLPAITNPTYRNITDSGKLKLLGDVTGKFLFQIYDNDEAKSFYISKRYYRALRNEGS